MAHSLAGSLDAIFCVTPRLGYGYFAAIMKRLQFLLCLGLALAGLHLTRAADPKPAPAADPKTASNDQVAVLTFKGYGDIVLEFWPDVAPKTVENFKKLTTEKFYNGTRSHRLIPGFMIQLGDPLTKDPSQEARWGTGDPGYKIKAEFNSKPHVKGVFSMARSQDPDSAGSQFFICFANAGYLDGKYTVFGHVLQGMDVLDKLEKVPVGGRQGSSPQTPVVLESVKLVSRSDLKSSK